MVRIGIDALAIVPGHLGGGETYFRGLLRGLTEVDGDNEYVIFCSRSNRGMLGWPGNFREVGVDFPAEHRAKRILAEQVWLPLLAQREGIDVLLCPNTVCPLLARCKIVVVVQSLQPLVVPEFRRYTTFLRFMYICHMTRLSARRADHIIAVSHSTKRDICSTLGISPTGITVTHEGVSHMFRPVPGGRERRAFLKRYGIQRPFILYASSFYVFKNFLRLVDAFAELKRRWRVPHLLVLSGLTFGWCTRYYDEVRRRIRHLDLEDQVILTGPLPHEVMPVAYSACDLFVYPSLYETFGLPPLEAMACGVPVICSNRSSLPEVVGDAAVQVDPYDVPALAVAMHRVLSDPERADELVKKGRRRSRHFQWRRTARQTLTVIEKVHGNSGRSPHTSTAEEGERLLRGLVSNPSAKRGSA